MKIDVHLFLNIELIWNTGRISELQLLLYKLEIAPNITEAEIDRGNTAKTKVHPHINMIIPYSSPLCRHYSPLQDIREDQPLEEPLMEGN